MSFKLEVLTQNKLLLALKKKEKKREIFLPSPSLGRDYEDAEEPKHAPLGLDKAHCENKRIRVEWEQRELGKEEPSFWDIMRKEPLEWIALARFERNQAKQFLLHEIGCL